MQKGKFKSFSSFFRLRKLNDTVVA